MTLSCTSVQVAFRGNTYLRDVNLEIRTGQVVLLYGPSGYGKTSLFNVLAGIQSPANPLNARVAWGDFNVRPGADADRERTHRLGLVFSTFNFLTGLNVEENITLPAVLAGLPTSFVKQRLALLRDSFAFRDRQRYLDLASIIKMGKIHELSNGQNEIVAIARALLVEPPFLLADEMLRSFDSETESMVWERLFEPALGLGKKMGLLLITHKDHLAEDARVDQVYSIGHNDQRLVARRGQP